MLIELHCHTNHSDGIPTVRQLIDKAGRELDGVAITDHNTFSGYQAARKLMPKCLLIPGIEVTCRHNVTNASGATQGVHHSDGVVRHGSAHVVALGVEELEVKAFCTLGELIEDAHSRGGLVINAHPFGGFSRNGFNDVKSARKFDAIEILNGNTLPSGNKKAAALAIRLKKPVVAGSDAHRLQDVGKFACTIDSDTVDGILKSIKKGKIILPDRQTSTIPLLTAKMKRQIRKKLKLIGG